MALTSDRKETTYAVILDVIREEAHNRGISFAPHTIISDYERSWINAVNKKVNAYPLIFLKLYSLFLNLSS